MKKIRKPDIAFWFDEESQKYTIVIRDDIRYLDLIKAAFDLIARAVKEDRNITEMEWEEYEGY